MLLMLLKPSKWVVKQLSALKCLKMHQKLYPVIWASGLSHSKKVIQILIQERKFLTNMLSLSNIPLSSFLDDKQFRLYNTIRSRIKALEWQRRYSIKNRLRLPYSSDSHYFDCVLAYEKDILGLKEILARLVSNSLFCNKLYLEVLQSYNAYPKTIQEHSVKLLGFYVPKKLNLRRKLYQYDQLIKYAHEDEIRDLKSLYEQEENKVILAEKFLDTLKKRCLNARKAELLNRLRLEMHLRVKQGWFVVFNTLTVDNNNQERVFENESTAWTDYVRSVDRAVGISIFGNWRTAYAQRKAGVEFHTYFAVVERGSVSGRLHIHILHFMKGLPYGCCDPNTGRSIPNLREITALKKFWKFGFSTPIAVRFDMSDAYAKLFWRWAVKKENGQFVPIKISNPDALVFYIGKYMTKEFDKPINRKEIKWRTKMSQSLGKTIPQMIVKKANFSQLETILRLRSSNVLQFREKNLPLWTMKKLAMKKILKLRKKQIPQKLWTTLTELKPQDSIMSLLKLMIQKKDIPKLMNFGNLRALKLLATVGSSLQKLIKDITDDIFGVVGVNVSMRGSSTEVRYA